MIIDNRKNVLEKKMSLFKSEHFKKLLCALESIYNEYWYLIKEDLQIEYEEEILKLIKKLYKIFANVQSIEQIVYKTSFSWKDINELLYSKINNWSNFIIPLKSLCLEKIDRVILKKDLKYLNKLHYNGPIEIDNLSALQSVSFSWTNSIQDYLYKEVLLFGDEKPTGLTIREFEIISLLIEEILKVSFKNNKLNDLINAKNILTDYSNQFQNMFDFIIA